MEIKIMQPVTVNVKYVRAFVNARYWTSVELNGITVEDDSPFPGRPNDRWYFKIDVDTGELLHWPKGQTASVWMKVCDRGSYYLMSETGEVLMEKEEEYCPGFLCIGANGYGDYISLDIDENGHIRDWRFTEGDVDFFYRE